MWLFFLCTFADLKNQGMVFGKRQKASLRGELEVASATPILTPSFFNSIHPQKKY